MRRGSNWLPDAQRVKIFEDNDIKIVRIATPRLHPNDNPVDVNRSALGIIAFQSLVGSNLLVCFPYFPLRNVERLCPNHEVPPIAG
jgi:hypothetical protein